MYDFFHTDEVGTLLEKLVKYHDNPVFDNFFNYIDELRSLSTELETLRENKDLESNFSEDTDYDDDDILKNIESTLDFFSKETDELDGQNTDSDEDYKIILEIREILEVSLPTYTSKYDIEGMKKEENYDEDESDK